MNAKNTVEAVVDKLDPATFVKLLASIQVWLIENLITYRALGQLIAVLVVFGFAWLLHKPARDAALKLIPTSQSSRFLLRIHSALSDLSLHIIWLVFLWVIFLIAEKTRMPFWLIETIVSLVTAWIVINFASYFIGNRFLSKFLSLSVWTIAALNIVDLLDPTIAFLDTVGFDYSQTRISLFTLSAGILSLIVLVWLAFAISNLAARRLNNVDGMTPSAQILLVMLIKITLVIIAVITGLSFVGIDITALAIFTGALGVGIGLGLQKVVSNLFSGLILLVDKSIKPGDVIAVGETYGWVNHMGARYVSVVTILGVEYLIPNDTLITQRVENWSYSNDLLGLATKVGISYDSDMEKAIELIIESAAEHERVLEDPSPKCYVKAYGDSAIELEFYFWIRDPKKGIVNVRSDILRGIWKRFHENNIKIPYPQRDLHVVSAEGIQIARETKS